MRQEERLRLELIAQFGGACQQCGYNKTVKALHFHHIDSTYKKEYSDRGEASLEEIQEFPERFLLLCANCHVEEHDSLDKAKRTYATCLFCGKEFRTKPYLFKKNAAKYCSLQCHHKHRGALAQTQESLSSRFWNYVHKTDTCWLWTGYRDPNGYGRLGLGGRNQGIALAHRISWELHNGTIQEGLEVLHHCNNPSCVYPEHLFLGSQRDNVHNMIQKDRNLYGERCSWAKLTEEQVLEIRQRYATGSISQEKLAQEYGVKRGTISDIVLRKKWSHLPDLP